jgi:outer membrane protein TolC
MDEKLPEWENELIDDAVGIVEARLEAERARARKRALQLAREQGYHRLAVAIDRPSPRHRGSGQLSLFPTEPTLFDHDPAEDAE